MSVAISLLSDPDVGDTVPVCSLPIRRRMHRLAEVRRQEGLTRRTIARRLNISVDKVMQQERDVDPPLSTLFRWQKALDIPLTELLVEADTTLSKPVIRRARLLRMMKTIMTIAQRSKQSSIRRLSRLLAHQLSEAMPELKDAEPWPAVGKRRTKHELGQAALRRFVSDVSVELDRDFS